MAIITIPAVKARSIDLKLLRNDSAIGLMSGAEVIMSPPGALWSCAIPLGRQRITDARAWFAALVQLSKLGNTFKLKPPDYLGPGTGYAGPVPLVNGASQLGTSIIADGVTASAAIALAGDYLEVNGEFKTIISDATADGVGNVTFNFEPALRASPADNASIDIQTPQIELRLLDPVAGWSVIPPARYDITLQAIESFGP